MSQRQKDKPRGDVMEIVVWFSSGVSSAIAAKLTLDKYGKNRNVRIVNNPVAEEDYDNLRFLRDVESWLDVKIEIANQRC